MSPTHGRFDRPPRARVLHVGKYAPPHRGGIERVVHDLARGLVRAEVDATVLVSADGPRSTTQVLDGVPVERAGRLAEIAGQPICPSLRRRVERLAAGPGLVHLHHPNPLADLAVLGSGTAARRPWVVSHHAPVTGRPVLRRLTRSWPRQVLERAAAITVASPRHVEDPALADHRDRVRVLPYGLDLDRATPRDADREAARAARREDPRPCVLFVGRLVPYKGVDVLLEAAAGLEARIVVVGDGPLAGDLRAAAERHGVAATFTGAVTDAELRRLRAGADVAVLPSTTPQEAFGLVQVEAFAAGLPVVSTDLPTGVPWVNRDGRTGLVVPPGDPEALRAALDRLLADADLRATMGTAARARAEAEFSLEAMVRRHLALYRRLLPDVAPWAAEVYGFGSA